MITRRTLLAAAPAFAACSARAATPEDGFARFVAGVKAEAMRKGISSATLEAAFANVRMNPRVIELDRHQPEFSLTWEQYRARIVSDTRVAKGRELYARTERSSAGRPALRRLAGCADGASGGWRAITAWRPGAFNVIEGAGHPGVGHAAAGVLPQRAVRRAEDFGTRRHRPGANDRQLRRRDGADPVHARQLPALRRGLFGDGRRDIWGDLGDVFASTANYLAREGWRGDLSWGTEIALPAGFPSAIAGREHRRAVAEWARLGVRPLRGELPRRAETMAAVILPGGIGGRGVSRLSPELPGHPPLQPLDFYCISVGLIGDAVTA